MRPPEPDPSPFRVDVINGWPHLPKAGTAYMTGLFSEHCVTRTKIDAETEDHRNRLLSLLICGVKFKVKVQVVVCGWCFYFM